MRKRKDGVLSTPRRWPQAGQHLERCGLFGGQHGVVAMSTPSTWRNASTASAPASFARARWRTPILDKRPVPVTRKNVRAWRSREDVGDLIRYVACLPPQS